MNSRITFVRIAKRSKQFARTLKANYIWRITFWTLDLVINETVQVIERFVVVQDLICIPLPKLGILPIARERQLDNYSTLSLTYSMIRRCSRLRMLATGRRFALYCCEDWSVPLIFHVGNRLNR